jgi:hypothetical protein
MPVYFFGLALPAVSAGEKGKLVSLLADYADLLPDWVVLPISPNLQSPKHTYLRIDLSQYSQVWPSELNSAKPTVLLFTVVM